MNADRPLRSRKSPITRPPAPPVPGSQGARSSDAVCGARRHRWRPPRVDSAHPAALAPPHADAWRDPSDHGLAWGVDLQESQQRQGHRATAFPSVSLHFQGYAYPALLPLLQGA
ncbi:hypothetical protein [uncultured Thiocystis sp.]|uniref:hypothetical protein n=1 Tax=uncultured Thiocystis sp. TaxID=1202134 RepID=UPI0025E40F92|nr:hypothetical protein [uncultured Thiocystis sp.]